jgi:hypothetical protein
VELTAGCALLFLDAVGADLLKTLWPLLLAMRVNSQDMFIQQWGLLLLSQLLQKALAAAVPIEVGGEGGVISSSP